MFSDVIVIGITKPAKIPKNYKELVYITPTVSDCKAVIEAGADIVAFDGTKRKRPNDEKLEDLNYLLEVVKSDKINKDVINYLKQNYNTYQATTADKTSNEYYEKCREYDSLIFCAENITSVDENGNILSNGVPYEKDKNKVTAAETFEAIKQIISDDIEALKAKGSAEAFDISKGKGHLVDTNGDGVIDTKDDEIYPFNISNSSLDSSAIFNLVESGIVNRYKDEITNMTLGDILAGNIVLMSHKDQNKNDDGNVDPYVFKENVMKLFDSLVATLGYSKTEDLYGTGLYVDDASKDALAFAYYMVESTYLNPKDLQKVGSSTNKKSMVDNSAYQNAVNTNRIGSDSDQTYYAVSLSNLMSAFLTYYDNALAGINSPYVVGVTAETSEYVTDNLDYYYMAKVGDEENSGAVARAADFYDQVYNNILEHGWREDAAIEDSEYLEAALKDGRYSMSSLNQDGYYYQTRYNETGYMVEVSDTDAIARAEAEFTAMKAQLTYKEDTIDLKTKKLDAEISALSTEYDTVKNLISKSIEKTFAMFQN